MVTPRAMMRVVHPPPLFVVMATDMMRQTFFRFFGPVLSMIMPIRPEPEKRGWIRDAKWPYLEDFPGGRAPCSATPWRWRKTNAGGLRRQRPSRAPAPLQLYSEDIRPFRRRYSRRPWRQWPW